ncbi:MAG: BspA family leucine-rich repeat surface protein, partial [Atopobiaceae bacterium]|nr:BspA family leucine-rich repeat surface protein [Atopobiaceae bacterium]
MITFTDVTIEGDASNMFEGFGATTINASGLNVTGVTSMSKMFSDCSALASIDGLSNWNTGSVTSMSNMFNGCKSLTTLDGLSKWDTSRVTNMSTMFN